MFNVNTSKLEDWLAAMADRMSVSAERIQKLRQRYDAWCKRFAENPVFKEIHAKATRAWEFINDPTVPTKAKAIVLAALPYVVSVDLIPDWLPVVGLLDDLVGIAMATIDSYRARKAPPEPADEPAS